jgi:type IV secretory pathway component VirB8
MDCKSCKRNGKVFDDDLDKARLTKINRRLVAAVVIIALFAIAAIVVNNIVWLHKWTQFDTVSYSYDQDGEGVNVIGNENGVKYNVTEVESESADQTDAQH